MQRQSSCPKLKGIHRLAKRDRIFKGIVRLFGKYVCFEEDLYHSHVCAVNMISLGAGRWILLPFKQSG